MCGLAAALQLVQSKEQRGVGKGERFPSKKWREMDICGTQ